MTAFLVGGIIAMVVGVGFALQGRQRKATADDFVAGSLLAQGVVTDLRMRRTRAVGEAMGNSYWAPVVRFTLADGQVVEAESGTGSNPAPARVGEQVTVHYDPADPSRMSLAGGLARPGNVGCLHVALGWGIAALGAFFVLLWFLVTVVFGLPV